MGPPGAGKGTLSQLCIKRLGWRQLSTGNLCRQHIARGTELGKKIDFAIKSGKLIEDSLMIGMVDEWLASVDQSCTVIFDGFPRTVAQAHALHELIEFRQDLKLRLIRLSLSDQDVMYRLLARSICQDDKCQLVYSLHEHSTQRPMKEMTCNECGGQLMRRSDDEEVAIAERLKIYHEHEKGLLSFYQEQGHEIKDVEAALPLEEVYAGLLTTAGYKDV